MAVCTNAKFGDGQQQLCSKIPTCVQITSLVAWCGAHHDYTATQQKVMRDWTRKRSDGDAGLEASSKVHQLFQYGQDFHFALSHVSNAARSVLEGAVRCEHHLRPHMKYAFAYARIQVHVPGTSDLKPGRAQSRVVHMFSLKPAAGMAGAGVVGSRHGATGTQLARSQIHSVLDALQDWSHSVATPL